MKVVNTEKYPERATKRHLQSVLFKQHQYGAETKTSTTNKLLFNTS